MWTLYAAGLNPQSFAATEAALVHNTYPEPENFPKMIWSTNYTRLACQVMFTFFFAGRDFAPKCIIDGKNIQDYLQSHFIAAVARLAKAIHDAGDLENDVVIGWESMNEPNRGLVGWPDISAIPSEQKLQKGTSPTAWQAILTGSGRAVEIDTWDFGGMGPYKSGRVLVDPQGEIAWLPADYDDSRYGYKRDPGWKLGTCIWAQHGIWEPESDSLLKKDYFSKNPRTGDVLNYEEFTNTYFMDYYRAYRDAVRAHHKDSILFCQPPVLEIPPSIKDTKDDDPKMVYAPHYYDGVTLMTKKWNRYWNVDVFGLLRGRYYSPAFAIKIGETAIRNSFRDQMGAIRQEGIDYMGNHPCVLTEFGIPYDMDDKHAYKTGDYSSQTGAMDANHYGVEGSGMAGYTLWLYMTQVCNFLRGSSVQINFPQNTHSLGDQWNGEDLSIYSLDDRPLPVSHLPPTPSNRSSINLSREASSSSIKQKPYSDDPNFTISTIRDTLSPQPNLKTPSIVSSRSSREPIRNPILTATPGFRAAEAYVRPSPIYVCGTLISSGFDLRSCTFNVRLNSESGTTEEVMTEIFLPEYHFPRDRCEVEVSSGKWSISSDAVDEGVSSSSAAAAVVGDGSTIQVLRWRHGKGEQWISVKGVPSSRQATREGDEVGYLEQCAPGQGRCALM